MIAAASTAAMSGCLLSSSEKIRLRTKLAFSKGVHTVSLFSRFKDPLLDLYRSGPAFLLGAIKARFSANSTVNIKISTNQAICVRPRQSDFDTLRQIFRDQDYKLPHHVSKRVLGEYERIIANGMVPVILDAGANIGAASIWFKIQFPNAAIIAIEPDPASALVARRNIAGLKDVILLEAAIGGTPGFVSMAPAKHAWAVKTERATDGCTIVTVDEATGHFPSGRLLLAKIDIEGFESDLFSGDLRWMDDVFAVIIEPHDWMMPGKGSSRSFQAAFGNRDFEIFSRGENLIYLRRD